MAVRPCHECGQPRSSLAKTCPHCGAPRSASVAGILSVIAIALFVLLLIVGRNQPSVPIKSRPASGQRVNFADPSQGPRYREFLPSVNSDERKGIYRQLSEALYDPATQDVDESVVIRRAATRLGITESEAKAVWFEGTLSKWHKE